MFSLPTAVLLFLLLESLQNPKSVLLCVRVSESVQPNNSKFNPGFLLRSICSHFTSENIQIPKISLPTVTNFTSFSLLVRKFLPHARVIIKTRWVRDAKRTSTTETHCTRYWYCCGITFSLSSSELAPPSYSNARSLLGLRSNVHALLNPLTAARETLSLYAHFPPQRDLSPRDGGNTLTSSARALIQCVFVVDHSHLSAPRTSGFFQH